MGRRIHRAAARARGLSALRAAGVAALPALSALVSLVALAVSCHPVRERPALRAEDIEARIPARQGIVLAGTLTRPAGARERVPVVLLIGGSGPQERDGARAELPGYRPFRDLADSLAAQGIATLRLDDRGTGASTGRFAGATTLDFADDVAASLRWLRTRSDVDGAGAALLGHSEGALVALLAASRDTLVSALVLLASPSRTGRELARWQRAALVLNDGAEFAPSERSAVLAKAEADAERAAAADPWLHVWFSLDPQAIARVTRAPALVLHGSNDRQVPVEQASELARALSSRRVIVRETGMTRAPLVEVHRFPSTDHLFLEDHDGDPRSYARLVVRSIRPDVSATIGAWLRHRFDERGVHLARVVQGVARGVAQDRATSSHHVRARAPEGKTCAPEEKSCAFE